MFSSRDIHPVSDFNRAPAEYIKRLKATGKPELLTVNGRASVVIQDAAAYEHMLELLDSLKHINEAAAAFDRGEGEDALVMLEKLRQELGIPNENI